MLHFIVLEQQLSYVVFCVRGGTHSTLLKRESHDCYLIMKIASWGFWFSCIEHKIVALHGIAGKRILWYQNRSKSSGLIISLWHWDKQSDYSVKVYVLGSRGNWTALKREGITLPPRAKKTINIYTYIYIIFERPKRPTVQSGMRFTHSFYYLWRPYKYDVLVDVKTKIVTKTETVWRLSRKVPGSFLVGMSFFPTHPSNFWGLWNG